MKVLKLNNGTEILNLASLNAGGSAQVRLRAPFEAEGIKADKKLAARMKEFGSASMWFGGAQQKNDNFNYESIGDVLPQDGDFITVPFRSLSKRVVPGHWLDFTRDGVLEAAVEMLAGQTLYPNHDFFDINNALGSVASAEWDGDDKAGKGFPGINALYKIDALMNPRISRLLLMKPPGIHSTSLTVLFDFEFSHPQLAEEGRFWNLLGEEVEGETVRMIVSEIHEIWEASLVFQGADRQAKTISYTDADEDEDTASFSATAEKAAEDEPMQPHSNEEKTTMKVIEDQKKSLGIECEGEDVPDTDVLNAALALAEKVKGLPADIEDLKTQAAAGLTLVEAKRAEVTAQAKLAELGAAEGDLDEVVVDQINNADADGLIKLGAYFDKKVAKRFPNGRSSEEDSEHVDSLVADDTAQVASEDPTGGLFGS